MSRLLYLSDSVRPILPAELETLVSESSARNELRGITGLLLCSGGQFLQVLEGDPLRLASLYTRIAADPRHANVRVLLNKPATARLFPTWGMNLVDADRAKAVDRQRIDRVLLRLRLTKDAGNGDDALTLMSEVRAQMTGRAA